MVNVHNVIAMLLVMDRTTLGQKPIDCDFMKRLFPYNVGLNIKCGKFGEPGRPIVCVIVIKQHKVSQSKEKGRANFSKKSKFCKLWAQF